MSDEQQQSSVLSAVADAEVNGVPDTQPEQLTPAALLQMQADAEAAAAAAAAAATSEEPADTTEDAPAEDAPAKKTKPKKTGPIVPVVSSEEEFPSLGGPAKTAPVSWNKSGSSTPVPEPATSWKPKIAVAARPQQTRLELTREQKRPVSELRKPLAEVIKDVQKRTGTKIDVATREGTSIFIIVGNEQGRDQAFKEINRELGVRVTKKVPVPAAIRAFVIGKQGSKIAEIQNKTFTRIKVPQPSEVPAGEYEDDIQIEVSIEGSTAGVAEATAMIQKIVSERVIKITRRINAPGELYPFIQGPGMENVINWETKVDKVLVPDYIVTTSPAPNFSPATAPIQVIGEKSAVEGVVAEIEAHIAQLKAAEFKVTTAEIPPFSVQLFTRNRGAAIHKIRKETGCTVITPPPEKNVPKVYIYGPAEKRGPALNAVDNEVNQNAIIALDLTKPFAKAPIGAKAYASDIVRFLRRKPEIQALEKEFGIELVLPSNAQLAEPIPSVYVFLISNDKTNLTNAKTRFVELVSSYMPEKVGYVEIEPLHHKHVHGRDGKGPKKITAQTSVELLFSEDPEEERITLIYDGPATEQSEINAAIEQAKELIQESVKGQAEIVSKTIAVPADLHEKIQGERGTTLNALNPSSVFVNFGVPKRGKVKADQTEDSITLRGPPANVDTVAKNIQAFIASLQDGEVEIVNETFEYPKQFSGNLIGQKGANINKLKEELGVDIKLNEGKGEIKGIRVCVDAAKRKLFSQVKELEDKAILTVKVPAQYHSIVIGSEGSTVKRLEERYNVRINFPKAGKSDDGDHKQAADEIIVRGPKKGAEEAKNEITELWKYEAENSHTATIPVTARTIGFMFKNASKDIKALRDESTCRIIIPQEDKSADPETTLEIRIRGKKSEVEHARSVLTTIAENAQNTTSRTITVEKKFHRSLIGPSGQTLRKIVVDAGGPDDRAALARMVRFPNQGSESDEITVNGNTDVVNKIIASITSIVEEKSNQITETIQVAPSQHRNLIGREGATRRALEAKFHVTLDIPRQRHGQPQTDPNVTITGTPEAVEAAKAHIEEITKEVEGETMHIPLHLHHAIANGQFFKQLASNFRVHVDHAGLERPAKPADPSPTPSAPAPLITDEESEASVSWEVVDNKLPETDETYPWILRGPSEEAVAKAKASIEKALENVKKQSATGYLVLPDPRKYRFVVGPGGSTVEKIRKETGCRIQVPRSQEVGEAIVVQGSREGLEKAKEKILEVVRM